MFGILIALLAAAVLGTGGAVYAADGASPGSALYGLDRATENVQYALTLDAHDKAELALQNATERLLEARDNAQNGDEEGVTEALAGYDVAYQNAINLLKNSDPLLLKAAFEEQNTILNEIAAEDTCTDVDGDGFDDVTGESCTPPAPTCTDADGDGFDDVTGESCTPPAPTCTDADGDGADDVTGEPCAAPAPTCTDADGDGADDFTGEPCAAAETFQSCVGADPHPVGQFLADQYGVTYETIMGYFCGTAATDTSTGTGRNGFGEIRLAFRIAEVSGDSVENILALRDSGLGWGQIKQQYGLVGNGKNATDEPSTLSTDQGNGKSNNGNGGGNGNGNGNSGGGNGNNGNHGNGNGGGNSNGNGNGNGNGGGNGNGNGGGHKP